MVKKDNYATISPLNEGAGASNTYMADTPFGNVKIYDLDAQIPPIERVQIVPEAQNVAPTASNVVAEETTTTIVPITSKKPNYLVYGGGALAIGLVAYLVLKKK